MHKMIAILIWWLELGWTFGLQRVLYEGSDIVDTDQEGVQCKPTYEENSSHETSFSGQDTKVLNISSNSKMFDMGIFHQSF